MARPINSPVSAAAPDDGNILVINSGSSSTKFALFVADPVLFHLWSGAIERIRRPGARFHAFDLDGETVLDEVRDIADHDAALFLPMDTVERHACRVRLVAVGHRVVHGGPDRDCAAVVTTALEDRGRKLIPLAPLHQPHNLAGVVAPRKARPTIPEVASFRKICAGLNDLGVVLDPLRNAQGERVISAEGSLIHINSFRTDEQLVIARHTRRVLSAQLNMQGG